MDAPKKHIASLREDFMKGSLDEADVQSNPFMQFEIWMQQALDAAVPEPHAMHLSTVSKEGNPGGRIVYLREYRDQCFWFYTNYLSRKSNDLSENPKAALTFFWPELERQIRIEGTVTRASEEESNTYFNARPYASKIGAWASKQSQFLNSRQELESAVRAHELKFTPETIHRPSHWGGFVLKANYYEFWQGRQSRLHDRVIFTQHQEQWKIQRLYP